MFNPAITSLLWPVLRRLAGSACIALAASGCATSQQVATTVVDTNLAQELASNQMMLLNVVRAYHRHPMHFTRISQIRMPVGIGNSTFSLPIEFGPGHTNKRTLTTGISVSQGVDTAVIDTQEFMRGITTPVTPALMTYYLEQGWPQQLVLHMFVRVVEIYETKPGAKEPVLYERMENYPENEGRFGDFQKAVYQLGNCSIGLKSTSKATPYGAILGTDQLKDLRGMAQLQAAGVSVVPVDSTGAEIKTSTLYRLAKVTKGQEFELNDKFGPNRQCKGLPGAPGSSDPVMKGLFSAEAGRTEAPALSPSASGGSTFHANLVLRSPEAMLYYLGEVARAQIDGRSKKDSTETDIPVKGQFPVGAFTGPVADTKSVKEYVFFRIDKNAHAPAAVKVDYLGNSYGIPLAPAASDSDRSMQALSLLTQVLMLQNKGTESPSTSNVRLVD